MVRLRSKRRSPPLAYSSCYVMSIRRCVRRSPKFSLVRNKPWPSPQPVRSPPAVTHPSVRYSTPLSPNRPEPSVRRYSPHSSAARSGPHWCSTPWKRSLFPRCSSGLCRSHSLSAIQTKPWLSVPPLFFPNSTLAVAQPRKISWLNCFPKSRSLAIAPRARNSSSRSVRLVT